MLFNSVQFAIFFIIVYCLYLVLGHSRQNWMLLIASCIFYGAWDARFLLLMFISISCDYFCGRGIYRSQDIRKRKFFLIVSICVNLSILCFFKYFNFFTENFVSLCMRFGIPAHARTLNIILPVGISFYTFQSMSYTIDIYRKRLEPAGNYRDYALFVTYFPQLVAGPIMRAKDLLPQVMSQRKVTIEKFNAGCYFMLWGYFQKIFIADNLQKIVDSVFLSQPPYNGIQVLIAVYAFAFQIYCDFAGYSNIARGLGSCMGFDIMVNFNLPYFSSNPSEFWRRWHISLSGWFRDYVYIPLGGNRKGIVATFRNLMITMVLVGFWHGASWTFVAWGGFHGLLLISHRIMNLVNKNGRKKPASAGFNFVKRLALFHIVCIGWLIFRSQSLAQAANMFGSILSDFKWVSGLYLGQHSLKLACIAAFLTAVERLQYKNSEEVPFMTANRLTRYSFCYACILLIMFFGAFKQNPFIYFQF